MNHVFRSASRVALLAGLSLMGLGAIGCTVTTEAGPPAAYAEPTPQQARRVPPERRAAPRVDPEFREAVAELARQTRAVRFAPEYRQAEELRGALRQLADALELAPYGRGGRTIEAVADRIRRNASQIGVEVGGAREDSRFVRAALEQSAAAIEHLADRRYGGSPEVQVRAFRLARQVEQIRPWDTIRRQSGEIVVALETASEALQEMLAAAERGEVR